MQDFFQFLLALITFQWLGDRSQTGNFDDWLVMFGPKGKCVGCADDVYFDTQAIKWKHLSSKHNDHRACPVPFEVSPIQTAQDRADRLASLKREIDNLTQASDRLALAPIADEVALTAMDRINADIATLILERDKLQIEIDLTMARA